MFLYNWQVREDWSDWCKSIPTEELYAQRIGGLGGISKNLIHVIDCELIWINYMLEYPHAYPERNSISNLDDVVRFSNFTKAVTKNFFKNWTEDYEMKNIQINTKGGTTYSFTYGKVIRAIVSHEIHQ